MAQKPFTSDTVVDGFASFEAGMNSDVAPLLLQPNQLSFLTNGTVRGTYATHRPPFNKQTLNFGGNDTLKTAVLNGLWQGGQYYKPDQGIEQILISVSGRLFLFTPTATDWTVAEVTVPNDPNNPTVTQVWMWQAEKWMFITDGTTKLPIYFDGTSSRRSKGNVAPNTEFPAGRMGCYGMGRVWMSLLDGKQFMAGDIVDGSSGTLAYNYRDSVLHSTENAFLVGGGYFTTPGAWGDIRGMIFTTTLDTSMGQGPMLVLTPTRTFSCYAPTDRTTWGQVTNPILTESLITNGAEGFYSTVIANGDVLFRAVDGIRSLIIGRRDFTSWGNVPVSSEMDRVLQLDVQDLLLYSSAIVFDNRLLMTAAPTPEPGHGVFHRGIVALNFDPLSTIRGKQPSIYDGLWTGLNTLQLVVGRFEATERAFAFTYNQGLQEIELYEIGTTPTDVFGQEVYPPPIEIYDNGNTAIVWSGESPVMFKAQDPRLQEFHQLLDGEILVDNLVGTVDFELYYKPDQHPCWVPWFSWSECAPKTAPNSKPQFRPRMGLGQPASGPCDPTTNRPYREAYTFQVKWIIRGHCRVLGFRCKATTQPQPTFAKQQCKPLASTVSIT